MATRDFLLVAKPGIVAGNVLAAVGAFFVGSPDGVNWTKLLGLVVGTTLVIAAACVVNNYFDRDIDATMTRTRTRPLASNAIPLHIARWYAAGLFVIGFVVLLWLTNIQTAAIGALGVVGYTVVYWYAKRRTPYATLIGAFPGATPPLAGYVAATGHFDSGAWLLFAAMFAWQIPHFYAIGIRRIEDYRAAGVLVMPAVKGLARTVWEMRFFGVLFPVLCYCIAHQGYAGFMFGAAMVLVSLYWLQPMFSPHWRSQTVATATEVFKRSLIVLGAFCAFMTLSHILL